MADLQHDNLTSSGVHEPKHITSGIQSDSGKVITNDSTTAGQSEYRVLTSTDITEQDYYVTLFEPDSSVAESQFIVVPATGVVTEIRSVISDPLVTADNIYTFTVDGNATIPATLTVTQAASAGGDVDLITVTSGGSIPVGGVIEIANNGGNSDTAVHTHFVITIRKA